MKAFENSIIRLRSLETEDLQFLYDTENNVDFWEISNTVSPFSKHILESYIKHSHKDIFTTKQVRFIIETIENKRIAGMIDLFDYDPLHLRAGVGVVIIEQERQKSYAYNALKLIQEYAFNILKLNQLYCDISADNKRSIQLFEKSGFTINGKKAQWLNIGQGFKDVYFLQLMNE